MTKRSLKTRCGAFSGRQLPGLGSFVGRQRIA
jgi:hypothetical protein